MNQTLFVTKFFENWTKTKTKNYLWSIFLWNWKSIEERIFFFFTIYYFHNLINEFCHTFMMYTLLLKLTRTVVRNYRVLCMYNNESFTQTFLEFSLQKWERPHAFSIGTHFYKIPTMIYSPRLLILRMRKEIQLLQHLEQMTCRYMIGKRFFP